MNWAYFGLFIRAPEPDIENPGTPTLGTLDLRPNTETLQTPHLGYFGSQGPTRELPT